LQKSLLYIENKENKKIGGNIKHINPSKKKTSNSSKNVTKQKKTHQRKSTKFKIREIEQITI